MTMTETDRQDGRVVAIAGPVIDVEFPPSALPELNTAVEFTVDIEGVSTTVLAEVAQQSVAVQAQQNEHIARQSQTSAEQSRHL